MVFCNKNYDVMKLMKAADEGDTDAMWLFVSLCYASDDREIYENTKEKCFGYVKKLAAARNHLGYIWMADALVRGELVPKDTRRAIEFYEKAADVGDGYGYECIGALYFEGDGVPQDYDKAYAYFKKSKSQSSSTLYMIGEMYRMGVHFKQNMKKANKYYQMIVDGAGDYPEEYMDKYYEFALERLKGNFGDLEAAYAQK